MLIGIEETLDFYAGLTGGRNGWNPSQTLDRLQYIRSAGSDICGIFVFDECILGQLEAHYCTIAGLNEFLTDVPGDPELTEGAELSGQCHRRTL